MINQLTQGEQHDQLENTQDINQNISQFFDYHDTTEESSGNNNTGGAQVQQNNQEDVTSIGGHLVQEVISLMSENGQKITLLIL